MAATADMADTAAFDIVARVAEEMQSDHFELPGFPEAVLRIQRTLQSPDASADDVVRILSSEPALAAQALRIANSALLRRTDGEITDLRRAVTLMGFNMVRAVAAAFAIHQLRLREGYSAAARAEIETIWRDSVQVASVCAILARHCTHVSADEALLAGLLHVLGRLYIVMRAEGIGGAADPSLRSASACHALIGKAILAGWGLPAALQRAVERQDDVDYDEERVSPTHVLIAAKLLTAGDGAAAQAAASGTEPTDAAGVTCPAIRRIEAVRGKSPAAALEEHADEVRALRRSLSS
ncbi:MAG TPA: HDOD domain-containing protein [Gammaproteobacteria bacterium]